MAASAGWLRPPGTLLLGLFVLTLVSVSAVAWFGWMLLEQERVVESQRAQEALEQSADRIVSSLRGTLAEAGDRLASETPVSGVVLRWTENSLAVTPGGGLLFYPFVAGDPEAALEVFAEGEQFEFLHDQPEEALRVYQKLAASPKPETRAGALVRAARVSRRLGRNPAPLYRQLAAIPDARVAGVPAALLGRAAACDGPPLPCASALKSELIKGRWQLTRGQFEFYWSQVSPSAAPPAHAVALSELAGELWHARSQRPATRGEESRWISGSPYLLIWRGPAERRSVLIASPGPLLAAAAESGGTFTAVDSEGRPVAGERRANTRAVVRTPAESQLPWTIYVSPSQPISRAALLEKQRFLIAAILVMVLFLVFGALLIARAIRREAGVLRMQSDFVSAVSHEFRSPLTSLRHLSELLALGRVPSPERRQLYYETLVNETTRLQRVVEALLNFGRMEAGARQYHLEELDAAQLVKRVVAEFQPMMAEAGRRIEVSAAAEPCTIEADPDAICVALRNLLDNAIKYSPGRPVVWVDLSCRARRVAIRVRDEGPGVPKAERDAIFGKFVRGSAARNNNVKGSGVGLAMVRHIAAAHGGQVDVDSECGVGSTFTLLLPAVEPS